MPEVQQISRFYLKKKVIGSFSNNPVQDAEIEKLLIKLNLRKVLALAIFKLRF